MTHHTPPLSVAQIRDALDAALVRLGMAESVADHVIEAIKVQTGINALIAAVRAEGAAQIRATRLRSMGNGRYRLCKL